MLKQEVSMLQGGGWPRSCDACRAAASVVFCRADGLFLCSSCDSQAHAPGGGASRHERVWVCEACEQAPAVFACKADAAALCATCDVDVHSNPLASRHTRVPVLPITGDAGPGRERGGAPVTPFLLTGYAFGEEAEAKGEGEGSSALTWPFAFDSQGNYESRNYVDFFLTGNEVEEYRDLGEYKPGVDAPREGGHDVQKHDVFELRDGAEKRYGYDRHAPPQFAAEPEERRLGFGVPKVEVTEPFTLSYSISPSSIEERVVPDNTTDVKSFKLETTPSKGTLDLLQHPTEPTAAQSDRQARVLRYREKKKRRNFEKTIRYASRKAYAEIRPRVKGRFTKRVDPEQAADRMLHTAISAELTCEYTYGCGVVPSY